MSSEQTSCILVRLKNIYIVFKWFNLVFLFHEKIKCQNVTKKKV